eukprot:gene3455-3922_t
MPPRRRAAERLPRVERVQQEVNELERLVEAEMGSTASFEPCEPGRQERRTMRGNTKAHKKQLRLHHQHVLEKRAQQLQDALKNTSRSTSLDKPKGIPHSPHMTAKGHRFHIEYDAQQPLQFLYRSGPAVRDLHGAPLPCFVVSSLQPGSIVGLQCELRAPFDSMFSSTNCLLSHLMDCRDGVGTDASAGPHLPHSPPFHETPASCAAIRDALRACALDSGEDAGQFASLWDRWAHRTAECCAEHCRALPGDEDKGAGQCPGLLAANELEQPYTPSHGQSRGDRTGTFHRLVGLLASTPPWQGAVRHWVQRHCPLPLGAVVYAVVSSSSGGKRSVTFSGRVTPLLWPCANHGCVGAVVSFRPQQIVQVPLCLNPALRRLCTAVSIPKSDDQAVKSARDKTNPNPFASVFLARPQFYVQRGVTDEHGYPLALS